MYFGKVALISYLFSTIVLVIGYITFTAGIHAVTDDDGDNIIGEPQDHDGIMRPIQAFGALQDISNLDTIINRQINSTANTATNPDFIFGDFGAATRALASFMFNVPTGGPIADIWLEFGGSAVDALADSVAILIRLVITFCSACLVINLISGRDL